MFSKCGKLGLGIYFFYLLHKFSIIFLCLFYLIPYGFSKEKKKKKKKITQTFHKPTKPMITKTYMYVCMYTLRDGRKKKHIFVPLENRVLFITHSPLYLFDIFFVYEKCLLEKISTRNIEKKKVFFYLFFL